MKRLIARHRSKHGTPAEDPTGVLRRLAELDTEVVAAVTVTVVKSFGKAVFLTEGLLQSPHRTRSCYRRELQTATA